MATSFTSEGIPSYMMDTPNAKMPNPQDSQSLPMFNPQEVEPDAANVACEGDMGGAC